MEVTGDDCEKFKPLEAFLEASKTMDSDIMSAVSKFRTPTPVQAQSWPVLLSGRDVVGIAATGSGKTIAFVLPGLMYVRAANQQTKKKAKKVKCARPRMLVVAPTRELAIQSSVVAASAGKGAGMHAVVVYGGQPKWQQIPTLLANGGADILVATPGRLLDLMNDGVVDLVSCVVGVGTTAERLLTFPRGTQGNVGFLVLDEADRMLDLGFERDMRAIVGACQPLPTRQTAMFSATWPDSVKKIASEFLHQPVQVTIGGENLTASASVTQIVEVVEEREKQRKLEGLLKKYHKSRKNRILVFVLYKKEAGRVENNLNRMGWNAVSIHGDKTQSARIEALEQFKNGSVPLLVATDVAARGLDIPDVEYVINYSFPLTTEDYVHRIGRTGRGGATGTSHTFFTVRDKARAGELANVLREAGVEVPEALKKFGGTVKKKAHSLYGVFDGRNRGTKPMPKATRLTFH